MEPRGSQPAATGVAAEAGVSVTTVSHVLNDVSYARISAETRAKVKSAAVQLGYGPNRLAQALPPQGMVKRARYR